MKIFVTSDTHGEAQRLKDCLDQAGFDYEKDQLIHLGDVCDRGPDSKGVVDLLLKVKNLVSLRGNHDDWWLTFLKSGEHPSGLTQGGMETLLSYQVDNGDEQNPIAKIPDEHIDFYRNQRIHYTDDQNRFFCHAGFDTHEKIAEQDDFEFFWDRDLIKRATSTAPGVRLNDINDFKQIFIGHTPTISWKRQGERITTPVYAAQVVDIDTGGVYGGKISLLDITTDDHILYQA